MPGIARNEASRSIGWCIGPFSIARATAVNAAGRVVHRSEQVVRALQVFEGEFEEQALTRLTFARLAADRLIVEVGLADRLLEDRRVRGEPGHREVVDVTSQRAAGQQPERDVVKPEALAPRSCSCCVAFMSSPAVRRRPGAASARPADRRPPDCRCAPAGCRLGDSLRVCAGRRRSVPGAELPSQSLAQGLFHRGEDAQLVVHHHVVARGIVPLHRVEHQILNVDQHAAIDGLPEPQR